VQVVQAVLDLTGSRVLSAAGGVQRGRWVVGD
jgi:DNA polymerase/3'-5' exonuclease PolX